MRCSDAVSSNLTRATMRDESEIKQHELEHLSDYERRRVIRMSPFDLGQWREYGRINHVENKLVTMLNTNEINGDEYRERIENEIVAIRRQLTRESNEELQLEELQSNQLYHPIQSDYPVKWIEEGF